MAASPALPELATPSSAARRIVALTGASNVEAHDAELWVTVALTHASAAKAGGVASPSRLHMLGCLGHAYFNLLASHAALERNHALLAAELTDVRRSFRPCLLAAEKKLQILPSTTFGGGVAKDVTASPLIRDSLTVDLHKQVVAALALCIPYSTLLRFFQTTYASSEIAARVVISFKTVLQEFTQQRGFGLPQYETVGQTGPEHASVFTVRVSCSSRR